MAEVNASIASQLIPVAGTTLVLPNTAVAEIIAFSSYEPVENGPDWLLGTLNWRGLSVPLLSYERAAGMQAPDDFSTAKIAVLNALGDKPDLNFIAVVIQGLPHIAHLDKATLSADQSGDEGGVVRRRIFANGEPAVIPDLDALEQMILSNR